LLGEQEEGQVGLQEKHLEILLLLVIIVAVISVGVTVVVVVESSSIVKLSFVITWYLHRRASLGSEFMFVLSAFAMLAACTSRAAVTLSTTNCLMATRVMVGALHVDVLLGGILST
nr:hypothetical protein [Tanacetum cinerariifolium]